MASSDEYLVRAKRILEQVPLIDGHNDFPFMLRGWHYGKVDQVDSRDMPIAHTDMTRLRKGSVGGVFWSAYVPCMLHYSPPTSKSNDFSVETHYEALRETMQQIDIIYSLLEMYPKDLALARTSTEVWQAFGSGRVASLIGVEGLHQVANSASVVRNLHRLGVRYITLAHDDNNLYADSATHTPIHHGLSERGVEMIEEMNRIGMIIDLSHTSLAVQRHVISLSKAPVIFSHSSCSSLVDEPRNSPDEVLDLLKANGGVFMISFIRKLTDATEPTLERVADHIQHVGERIGYEHVGIGSDFDGVMAMPKGLEDVSKFPYLVAELLRRGVSERCVSNVVGLNVLRVLDAVGDVSDRMKRANTLMLHDVIEAVWSDEEREEVKRVRGLC